MKTVVKISFLGFFCILVLLLDVAPLHFVSDAEAQYGTRRRMRRRTARRTAVVVSSAESAQTQQAQQQAAASQKEAEAAKKEAADAEAEAAAAKQEAADAKAAAAAQPVPPPTGTAPIGTVVTALPDGCTTITSGGMEYYHCASNYYRAAFQGNQLVYVTTEAP